MNIDVIMNNLAHTNPYLSYYDLKTTLQKYDQNITGDDMDEFYPKYTNEVKRRHDYVMNKIKNKIKEKMYTQGKTKPQLKQLKDFKDPILTDEDIDELFKLYNPNATKKNTKTTKSSTPEVQDIKAHSAQVQSTINDAQAIIYDALVKPSIVSLLTEDQLLEFILNHKIEASKYIKPLYTEYLKQMNRIHPEIYNVKGKAKQIKADKIKVSHNLPPPPSPEIKAQSAEAHVDAFTIPYPFQSERKQKDFKGKFDLLIKPNDPKIQPLKEKFSRPSFAPSPYSWEIDHLEYSKGNVTYLFAININTRYLYCIRVLNKSEQETRQAIQYLIDQEQLRFNHPVNNIRGDGDSGFKSAATKYFPNLNFYFSSSPYTFHNKIVDAVMRTLRDALGVNGQIYLNGNYDSIIQQLVYYYNNTWHRMINMKPIEMHTNISKEWEYIRKQTEKLNEIKNEQMKHGLMNFKEGDKVMLHLDYGKTDKSMTKRRRRFDTVGEFIRYINGNGLVKVGSKIVEVPIYYITHYYFDKF